MAKGIGNKNFLILLPALLFSGFSLSILSSGKDLFASQLFFYGLGFFLYFLFSRIHFSGYKSLAVILYPVILLLLFLTFFTPAVRGSSRWIDIFGFRFQPSEFIKPLVIIFFANFFSRFESSKIKNLFFGFLLLLPIVFLIFKQPDLGTAIVVFAIWLGIVYASGLSKLTGLMGIAGLAGVMPLVWLFLKDYQKNRIFSFLDPYLDPAGAGYHSIQAQIAVGSGNFLGKGLGQGSQSSLNFLPEYHTDFIFATLVETFGFLGGIVIILTYAFLLFQLLRIAQRNRDSFASLIVLGTFFQIGLQVLVNIGMNLGVVPITGITLPLLSYGGSSLLSLLISLGMAANIAQTSRQERSLDILT